MNKVHIEKGNMIVIGEDQIKISPCRNQFGILLLIFVWFTFGINRHYPQNHKDILLKYIKLLS